MKLVKIGAFMAWVGGAFGIVQLYLSGEVSLGGMIGFLGILILLGGILPMFWEVFKKDFCGIVDDEKNKQEEKTFGEIRLHRLAMEEYLAKEEEKKREQSLKDKRRLAELVSECRDN